VYVKSHREHVRRIVVSREKWSCVRVFCFGLAAGFGLARFLEGGGSLLTLSSKGSFRFSDVGGSGDEDRVDGGEERRDGLVAREP
jgi:hypothetical protein